MKRAYRKHPYKTLAAAGVASLIALCSIVATGAQQGTHCKMPDHLAVIATSDNQPLDVGVSTVTLDPSLQCVNDPSYVGWGEIVSVRPNHPERGLHLFPPSVPWLSGRLRTEAANTSGTVTILHASGGQLVEWASLTPAAAIQLADEIDAASL